MASLIFNIALGRHIQMAINIDTNSPTNSAFILIPFFNDGSSTDDQVRDADTVAAVEALTGVTERTANGWNRKTLVDTDVTVTLDDTNNRYEFDLTDQNWTPTADAVSDLCLAYDADTGAGTDSDLVPVLWWDFSHTGDGTQVTAQINSAGAARAVQA